MQPPARAPGQDGAAGGARPELLAPRHACCVGWREDSPAPSLRPCLHGQGTRRWGGGRAGGEAESFPGPSAPHRPRHSPALSSRFRRLSAAPSPPPLRPGGMLGLGGPQARRQRPACTPRPLVSAPGFGKGYPPTTRAAAPPSRGGNSIRNLSKMNFTTELCSLQAARPFAQCLYPAALSAAVDPRGAEEPGRHRGGGGGDASVTWGTKLCPGGAARTPAGALGTECTVSPQADVPFNGNVSFYCKCCLFLLTWGQLSSSHSGQEHPQAGWQRGQGTGWRQGRGKSPHTRPATWRPAMGRSGLCAPSSKHLRPMAPWEQGASGKRRSRGRGCEEDRPVFCSSLDACQHPLRSCLYPQLTRTGAPFLRR